MPSRDPYLALDDIVVLAERESGAFGLTDDGLRARVSQIVDMINARGPYDNRELREMTGQIKRLLANRLHLALDRRKYSGIRDEAITRPVFIIGFARSGTTLLHSLLAEDPEVLKPQSWYMYSPSPPPGAGAVVSGRLAYADRMVAEWSDFCTAQKSLHPYVDKGARQLIEDEELFTLDFRNAYPFHYYRVPTLDVFGVPTQDHANVFRFHRELLQHFQWNSGKTRWVCKGPSHQLHLGALFEVYPDALCVWAHRPLADIYASNVAIRAAVYDTIRGTPIDWSSQARQAVLGMKAAVDRLIADDLIDDPRILHVRFKELSRDPLGVVNKVYERLGLPLTPDLRDRVGHWLADPENAGDRHGRYPHNYEAFGLDQAWVEELFADYAKRFDLV